MLLVIEKIILIIQWNTARSSAENATKSYFYDVFPSVMEFLIEMIQGTDRANLALIVQTMKVKGLQAELESELQISLVLKSIKPLILGDEVVSQTF